MPRQINGQKTLPSHGGRHTETRRYKRYSLYIRAFSSLQPGSAVLASIFFFWPLLPLLSLRPVFLWLVELQFIPAGSLTPALSCLAKFSAPLLSLSLFLSFPSSHGSVPHSTCGSPSSPSSSSSPLLSLPFGKQPQLHIFPLLGKSRCLSRLFLLLLSFSCS